MGVSIHNSTVSNFDFLSYKSALLTPSIIENKSNPSEHKFYHFLVQNIGSHQARHKKDDFSLENQKIFLLFVVLRCVTFFKSCLVHSLLDPMNIGQAVKEHAPLNHVIDPKNNEPKPKNATPVLLFGSHGTGK